MKLVEFVQTELERREDIAKKQGLKALERQKQEEAGLAWAKSQIIEQLCAEYDLDQGELNEIVSCHGSGYRGKKSLGKMFPSSAPEDSRIPKSVILYIRLSTIVGKIKIPKHMNIQGGFDLDQSCRYNVRQWAFSGFVYHSLFSALQAARKCFGDERFFSSVR